MSTDHVYDRLTKFSTTSNSIQRTFFPHFEIKFNLSLNKEFVASDRDLPLPSSHHRATARVIARDRLSFHDVRDAVEAAIGGIGNLPSYEHGRVISLAWEHVQDFVGPTGIVPEYVELDVDLEVWILYWYVSGDDDSAGGMVPAAEEGIWLLDECDAAPEEERCSICLEELGAALGMPCSHVFHGECIKTWLRKSHCCPLCRFPMPPASN